MGNREHKSFSIDTTNIDNENVDCRLLLEEKLGKTSADNVDNQISHGIWSGLFYIVKSMHRFCYHARCLLLSKERVYVRAKRLIFLFVMFVLLIATRSKMTRAKKESTRK